MQVYGGYGFIEEYPMAQLLRDCRITLIYEGTNGIQAMDLLGRKLGLNKGKPIMDLFGEMQKTLARAKEIESIQGYAVKVEEAVNKLAEVAIHMGQAAMSDKVLAAFANAHPFQDAAGDTVMAWMLLWRAAIAARKLEKAKKKDQPFYQRCRRGHRRSHVPVIILKQPLFPPEQGKARGASRAPPGFFLFFSCTGP
jgi:hypothetical protein